MPTNPPGSFCSRPLEDSNITCLNRVIEVPAPQFEPLAGMVANNTNGKFRHRVSRFATARTAPVDGSGRTSGIQQSGTIQESDSRRFG